MLKIFFHELVVSLEEGGSAWTKLFEIQNRSQPLYDLFKLKDTAVADSCMILPDDLKLCHSFHDVLLLLQSRFDYTSVDLFLEDELKIVIRVSLTIPDEVEMIEGADQSCPELVELAIYSFLYVAESHIELNVVELVEVKNVDRVEVTLLLDR